MRKNLFIFSFVLVLTIAVLNKLGVVNHLYWKLWWYDILMHFLGGLWIGLASLWIYWFSGYFKTPKKDWETVFVVSILSVFVIGVGWEIFEFFIEIDFSNNYVGDTTLDMIMDLIGSFVAGFIFIFGNKNGNQQD